MDCSGQDELSNGPVEVTPELSCLVGIEEIVVVERVLRFSQAAREGVANNWATWLRVRLAGCKRPWSEVIRAVNGARTDVPLGCMELPSGLTDSDRL